MGLGRPWTAVVTRRRACRRSGRVNWRTCRRCGSYSFQSAGSDRLCGGCLSLQ